MKTLNDIQAEVVGILKTEWKRREGRKVPEAEDIELGNDAVEIDGTVLYADMADSTGLVLGYKDWFSAEIYKAYLRAACEIIRNNDGVITAFDGDRVMAVFFGSSQNTSAAKAALQINYITISVINTELKRIYNESAFQLRQSVGVDTGKLLIARTGVRGANDLVWVGRSANYAAKMCNLRDGAYCSFITQEVFDKLHDSVKYGGDPKRIMWEQVYWPERGISIYRSSWWWKPS
jgi:class 3 adenylate cyclase